ncbi:UDP-glycosyltransferase 91D1 [Camellia lanceoleosa]|uniref:UDP-glycosyltransferase 91D1 n=1 Tax=Camellia lanceoleosa TaxID=1840588 RepID=A0ACC0IK00_9ERIC|nr:UDP-glycosyltransferase 91D1 [Camellia lanceoleosa]
MPIEQIHELAYGLELSNLPFIWILRKPEGVDSLSFLPRGFSTQTSDRSVVRLGWAPHQELLAHHAIGGCLFLSGWGLIIESVGFGHPPILMPMVGDQYLNAKLLMENGVGYEVPRNEDGSFNRDAVAESMRLVMVEQEGEPLQAKAAQMQTVLTNQDLHDKYVNKFIDYLGNL